MNKQWHFALFRSLTAIIFIYAGIKHIMHGEKVLGRIQKCSMYSVLPDDQLFSSLVFLSGVIMIGAAILLLIGKFQKVSAFLLLLVLIGITLSIQLEDLDDLGPFFKNVAIAGSLIFIIKNKNYEIQNA